MNKLLLLLAAACAGGIGSAELRRGAEHKRTATGVSTAEWTAGTNRLAETEESLTALRLEVQNKQDRLHEATRHQDITPALLSLLESEGVQGPPTAWVELRQQLGATWDASADYVLVSKRVLPQIDYQRFVSGNRVADTACGLLAIAPEEKAALQSVLQRTREQWPSLTVERGEPGGDVVAQYTVRPPGPVVEQTVSNNFVAEITGVVGQERAALLLPAAWREVRSDLGPRGPETLTVRRSLVDGQPDLTFEMSRDGQSFSKPVRYAHYPSGWFLTLFSGGWKTLGEKEGFELPPNFHDSPK